MSHHKLITVDLDGTVLFERKMSEADAAAINRWQEAGNIAVCNTGKSLRATQHALSQIPVHFDYYVLYTGAVIADKDYRVLVENQIDKDVVQEILEFLHPQQGIAVYATTIEQTDQRIFYSVPESLATDILQTCIDGSPAGLQRQHVIGIPIWAPDAAQCTELLEQLRQRFGAVVDVHQNQDFIDIVPAGANKGVGLQALLDYLAEQDITATTYSLGDSYNDLDMHAAADYGTAFPHSPEVVKEAAGRVSATAAEYINAILDGE